MGNQITFVDRNDLITKIENVVMKKADVNHNNAVKRLKDYFNAYKRGDKKAMQAVLKLRKDFLNAASEIYIEVEEDTHFQIAVAELSILDQISDQD